MNKSSITSRNPALFTIAIFTFVLASCFPYIVAGPIPAWIGAGLVCFGLALASGNALLALQTQRGAVQFTLFWLTLVVVMLILDLVGYAERDVMAGSLLNLFTLLIFVGMFIAALRANGRAIILTVTIVTLFQSVIAILQFLGTEWAWDLSTNLSQSLPFQRQDSQQLASAADIDFTEVGRVRGSHIFVHIFNAVQSAMVGVCTYMAINPNEKELPRGRLRLCVQAAAVIGATAMLLSFSRSGILALAGVLIISTYIRPSAAKIISLLIFGFAGILMLYSLNFTSSTSFARLTISINEDANSQIRIDHFRFALDNFIDNPISGTSGTQNVNSLELPIHSVPMRFLSDYGILGFIPYFLVFSSALIMSFNHVKSRQPERVFWGGALLCLIFVMLADGGTHSSGFLRRDIINSIMLGLLLGQASRSAKRAQWAQDIHAVHLSARGLNGR